MALSAHGHVCQSPGLAAVGYRPRDISPSAEKFLRYSDLSTISRLPPSAPARLHDVLGEKKEIIKKKCQCTGAPDTNKSIELTPAIGLGDSLSGGKIMFQTAVKTPRVRRASHVSLLESARSRAKFIDSKTLCRKGQVSPHRCDPGGTAHAPVTNKKIFLADNFFKEKRRRASHFFLEKLIYLIYLIYSIINGPSPVATMNLKLKFF